MDIETRHILVLVKKKLQLNFRPFFGIFFQTFLALKLLKLIFFNELVWLNCSIEHEFLNLLH